MTNTTIIVIGAVVVVLLVLFRNRLTQFGLRLPGGRLDAKMSADAPLPEAGARQRGIDATGAVQARDETGVGASQENVKGKDVVAVVTGGRPGGHNPNKTSG
jgi:hypothetical protein